MTAAVVVGAAESPYSRHPPADTTTLSVLADAGRRALASAGLTPRDVDGLAVASFSLGPDHAIDLAWRLGLRVRWLMDAHTGGASAVDTARRARRAVSTPDAPPICESISHRTCSPSRHARSMAWSGTRENDETARPSISPGESPALASARRPASARVVGLLYEPRGAGCTRSPRCPR